MFLVLSCASSFFVGCWLLVDFRVYPCVSLLACACLRLLLRVHACFCLCLPVFACVCLLGVCVCICMCACVSRMCWGRGSAPFPHTPPPPCDPRTQGCGRRNKCWLMCVFVCVFVCECVSPLSWRGCTLIRGLRAKLGVLCVGTSVCVYECVGGCVGMPRQRTEPLSYQRVFTRTRVSSRLFQKVSPTKGS